MQVLKALLHIWFHHENKHLHHLKYSNCQSRGFVGLVFLIFEIKQNSAIALSEIRQEWNFYINDQFSANARNEKFAALLGKLTVACAFDEITELDWYHLYQYEKGMKVRITDVWFQYEQGLMDDLAYKVALRTAAYN